MKPRTDLHDYWSNPPSSNDPKRYLLPVRDERSRFLVELVNAFKLEKSDPILEIGCNSGRNLNRLWTNGYTNLSGIEINQDAVNLMGERFPDMIAHVMVGPVEDWIMKIQDFEVIFTMAVLVHIHPDSNWIFSKMVERAEHIITIEDETTDRERHTPRNYKHIFERLGMKQMSELYPAPGMNKAYIARVFSK